MKQENLWKESQTLPIPLYSLYDVKPRYPTNGRGPTVTQNKRHMYSASVTPERCRVSREDNTLCIELIEQSTAHKLISRAIYSGVFVIIYSASTLTVIRPLKEATGTNVTRVYSFSAESSSSLRFLESLTLILYGTFLQRHQSACEH